MVLVALMAAGGALIDAAPATLRVPGRANANVSLAAHGAFVAAVWSASATSGATDIYAAVSRDAGATFSAPVRVNSTPGEARVNGEQPPRVTLLPPAGGAAPRIDVIWTASSQTGTLLLTSSSRDGGRTFAPSAPVADTGAPGNRGWQALGNDGTRPLAVWLDHRQLAARPPAGSHQHGQTASAAATTDGVAMAQLSQLYFAPLDGSVAPRPLTGGVCYCCKTAIAVGPNREIYLAWRHVYPGNMRDIAFTASRDGGRTFSAPVRVSEDRWAINGCPDDGPAMAVDRRGTVHVVWPTVVTEGGATVKALFHALSRDGVTFGPRTRLPTAGQANHPQLGISSSGALTVAWDESGDGSRKVVLARSTARVDGTIAFHRELLEHGSAGVYPAVTTTPGGVLLAWTSGAPSASVVSVVRSP